MEYSGTLLRGRPTIPNGLTHHLRSCDRRNDHDHARDHKGDHDPNEDGQGIQNDHVITNDECENWTTHEYALMRMNSNGDERKESSDKGYNDDVSIQDRGCDRVHKTRIQYFKI